MLKEMPHRDEIETAVAERLFVEQAAAELDSFEPGAAGKIFEVDASDSGAIRAAKFSEKAAGAAADVQNFCLGFERNIFADGGDLGTIELIHGAPIERCEPTPVGLPPMRDVLFVVVGADMLELQTRALVGETAPSAGNEGEATGLASQIVLGGDQRNRVGTAAKIAAHGLEHVRPWRRQDWTTRDFGPGRRLGRSKLGGRGPVHGRRILRSVWSSSHSCALSSV